MVRTNKRIGILVGGGPAPGINSAISACVIAAADKGVDVIGIPDGFSRLIRGDIDRSFKLSPDDVELIHFKGGSILRTSRANPTTRPENLEKTVKSLHSMNLESLISIGGEDTALSASEVAKASNGTIRVAHIPKTIDNDLPLPGDTPTFGYETARQLGTELVSNLMEDSRTTNRWFIVVVMGRKAGHLALGIGKGVGASLTIIPEEFSSSKIMLKDVVDVIAGSMLKRRVYGRDDGIVVIAEGVAEKIDPSELEQLAGLGIARDPHGHIRLGEIPVAAIIRREVQKRFLEFGEELGMVDTTLGYELRCAPPIPFDIDYTPSLGFGAVQFLTTTTSEDSLRNGGLVYIENGMSKVMPFDDMRDSKTNKALVRVVDTKSHYYTVARKYMFRLEKEDLQDETMLDGLTKISSLGVGDYERMLKD